jgi:diguanylate cyclase (GGDEF)-like protein
MEDELRALSLTDELTGLYNRRGFFTLAEQQRKIARRLKKKMVLMSADLDNLKGINDTWGHQEGDRALRETANILKECIRETDVIARIGGDEFVVLFIENAIDDSEALTARVQKYLDLHNARRTHAYELSLSVGIAHCPPECEYSINELLDLADALMYEQKRQKQKLLS